MGQSFQSLLTHSTIRGNDLDWTYGWWSHILTASVVLVWWIQCTAVILCVRATLSKLSKTYCWHTFTDCTWVLSFLFKILTRSGNRKHAVGFSEIGLNMAQPYYCAIKTRRTKSSIYGRWVRLPRIWFFWNFYLKVTCEKDTQACRSDSKLLFCTLSSILGGSLKVYHTMFKHLLFSNNWLYQVSALFVVY